MQHKVIPLLVFSLFSLFSAKAQMYNITADGDPSDWEANDGTYDSSTSLSIHGSGVFSGQWIYKGESGDLRTDGANPDSNYDITEIRVGASATTLYILVRMDDITDIGLPVVSIAMADSDNLGGFNYIGDGAETGTSGGTFLNNNASNVIDIHDPNNDGADPEFNTGSGFENRGTAVISTANDCIEYAIDFTDLNGSISQMSTLYISVMSGQDNNTFANDGDTFDDIFFSPDGLDGMTPGAGSGNFFGRSGGVGSFDFDIESASVPLSSANLLPVEFAAVTIKSSQHGHELNWVTASEINNDYFELQRSTDSKTWKVVSIVDGAGTSYEEQNYLAVDKTPQAGRNFYRIKQVDYDGSFSFSPIVSAVWRQNTTITLGPVPTSGVLSIFGLPAGNEAYHVAIYNTFGQLVHQEANIGESIVLDHLTNGVYYLQIKGNDRATVAKQQFVIQD